MSTKPYRLYIRPVHPKGGGKLLSLALCRYDSRKILLVDEDILEHFPPDTSGKDIKLAAVEFFGATSIEDVHWSGPIFT